MVAPMGGAIFSSQILRFFIDVMIAPLLGATITASVSATKAPIVGINN